MLYVKKDRPNFRRPSWYRIQVIDLGYCGISPSWVLNAPRWLTGISEETLPVLKPAFIRRDKVAFRP